MGSKTKKNAIPTEDPVNLDPFSLKNTFGFKKEVGFRFTRNKSDELIMIYCMSNIICLYNIAQKTWKHVTGHAYRITRLTLSNNGRILVSTDIRNVHIWDLKCQDENDTVILKVIKDPFGKHIDVVQAGLSSCSRYLVLISCLHKIRNLESDVIDPEEKIIEDYKIQFWDWSCDRDNYEDMLSINESYGNVKHLIFDCNEGNEKSFAITFEEKVIFGVITDDGKLLVHKPTICRWNFSILCTTYIKNTTLALSATASGKIILWDDENNASTKEKQGENIKVLYKIVKLNNSPVIDMTTIVDKIVTINKDGEIRFYDKDLKLMYMCTTQQMPLGENTLLSIWASIQKRDFQISAENVIIQDEDGERTIIPRNLCIQNYSIDEEPFIIRKFFLLNEAGELAMIDIVKRKYQMMLMPSEDFYVAMDIYPQKPWIIGCTKGRWLMIFNYETKNKIAKYYFQPKDKAIKGDRKILVKSNVSCIKVSHNEIFIALGYENGHLWMIDPVTAKETHELPFKFTDCGIEKIVFKKTDNSFCVLSDISNALVFIHFNGVKWNMLAKYQYHCMPIIGIFFFKYEAQRYLITIGYDRMYVRYKIFDSETEPLIADIDIRLDQAPKLTAAELLESTVLANDTSRSKNVIIVANNQCKFVFYDAYTTENLFTFLGPIYETPVQKIIFCPTRCGIDEPPMILFATKKSMGTAVLPLNGNPFKYSGILAHHTKITSFELNNDLTGVLIHGEGDVGPIYWDIKRDNVHKKLDFGGKGLEPFMKLLPGGKHGNFFNEMIQFFYYIQLMEDSTDAPERKTITDYIKISEIIDFMRAVGFFPSEYEAKNLMNEVTRTKESWAAPPTHISFTDLIQLYFNHRPAEGYRFSKILDSLKFILSGRIKFAINDAIVMNVVNRTLLLDVMTTKGEKVSQIQAMRYLLELLDDEDRGIKRKISELSDAQIIRNFKKLPIEINIYEFCYKVFGMENDDAEKIINIFEKANEIDDSVTADQPNTAEVKDTFVSNDYNADENDPAAEKNDKTL